MAGNSLFRLLFFLPVMLSLASCTSTPESADVPADPAMETGRAYSTWQDLRMPITGDLDLPRAEEVVPPPEPGPSWLPVRLPWWVWLPENARERPLFLGTSFPRVSRTEELRQCIRNAADQAARYAGIAAQVSSFRGTFREGTGYAEDLRLYYNQDLVPLFVEEAEVRTLHQDETGSYALVRFPSLTAVASPEEYPEIDILSGISEPGWIGRIPEVEGYYLGLGISRPRLRFADSIAEADKAALAEILLQLAAGVEASYDVRSTEGRGSSFQEDVYQYSSATVKGFRIVSRWRSPEGSYFYSLAVLPRR